MHVLHQPLLPGEQQPGLQAQQQLTSETAIHNTVLQHLRETLDDPTVIVVRWGVVVPLQSDSMSRAIMAARETGNRDECHRLKSLPYTANGVLLRCRTKNRLGALEIKEFIFKVEKGEVVDSVSTTNVYTNLVGLGREYSDALPNGQGGGAPAQGGLGNDLGKTVGK